MSQGTLQIILATLRKLLKERCIMVVTLMLHSKDAEDTTEFREKRDHGKNDAIFC